MPIAIRRLLIQLNEILSRLHTTDISVLRLSKLNVALPDPGIDYVRKNAASTRLALISIRYGLEFPVRTQ